VGALREHLHQAVQALAEHPADAKFHHALRLTWLDPGASQERVAQELGLPFNTYRYHLARGTDRVVQALWQRELQAMPVAAP
jgi:DNA-directed RNA polymerase specialized sigma24 family protein